MEPSGSTPDLSVVLGLLFISPFFPVTVFLSLVFPVVTLVFFIVLTPMSIGGRGGRVGEEGSHLVT